MKKYEEDYVRKFVRDWEATSDKWTTYSKNHPEEVTKLWQVIVVTISGSGPTWKEAEEIMVRELVTNRTKLGRALL